VKPRITPLQLDSAHICGELFFCSGYDDISYIF
jgi:hypothetical protein